MYVEDLVRPGINIAAEITTKDAYGFQEMCQMFAKKNICHKICQKDDEIWAMSQCLMITYPFNLKIKSKAAKLPIAYA